jgi:peptidylprolyl isomerase
MALRQTLLICCAFALGACNREAASELTGHSTLRGESSAEPLANDVPPDPPPPAESPRNPAPPDLLSPPKDAQRSHTGLVSKQLVAGGVAGHAKADDYADVMYTVWRPDGRVFAATSSVSPQRIKLAEAIAGLKEAVQMMSLGEKRRLWIPYALAFGSRPGVYNAPTTDLVYDLTLVKVIAAPTPPKDLNPPKSAKQTPSGLAYQVLKPGTGQQHPGERSRVQLQYSAWTPDGKMFETSWTSADSVPVRLDVILAGWKEGLQLMVEGERAILWIPGRLAHGDLKPGEQRAPFEPPAGPVVFDVELVKILPDIQQ